MPRAIGSLVTDRFIVANKSFLRVIGLGCDEISSVALSEIVTIDSNSYEKSTSGRLLTIKVRAFGEDLTMAGQAALVDQNLVVHENLAPEFMTAVFSLDLIRTRLEKENHPCAAELKAIEERITNPLQRMRDEIQKSDADQREYYLMSRRLAAIVENSDDAIISKDLNGMITSWNQGAERIFGYAADEMIGSSIRRIIPQDCQREEDEILAHLMRGERRDHFQTVRMTKEGRHVYVSLTISPIKDETGQVIGASKVARAITDRDRPR
ncbi:MAG TPA: PAS domain S-box protein [Nitrospiria bacterium]|nr:PAS domain S-box protein [Nitrospiria bacterium]